MFLAQAGCAVSHRGDEVLSMSASPKAMPLVYETTAEDGGHDLPHRPLHEIDIQGHQPDPAQGDYCPGQVSYFEPNSGLFLTCMGTR
jgi:hypothetical protein